MDAARDTQLIPPSRPLFDEVRLAVGGSLTAARTTPLTGYACDPRASLSTVVGFCRFALIDGYVPECPRPSASAVLR